MPLNANLNDCSIKISSCPSKITPAPFPFKLEALSTNKIHCGGSSCLYTTGVVSSTKKSDNTCALIGTLVSTISYLWESLSLSLYHGFGNSVLVVGLLLSLLMLLSTALSTVFLLHEVLCSQSIYVFYLPQTLELTPN